jgi:hypothetical protein
MFSQQLTHALACLSILVCAASEGHAQDTRAYERRVDSMIVTMRRLHALRATANDSLRRLALRQHYDTVMVGPLRILTDSGLSITATRAARTTITRLAPLYGSTLDSLADRSFVIRTDLETGRRMALVTTLDANGRASVPLVAVPDVEVVTAALRHVILQALADNADPTLTHWLGAQLPDDSAATITWGRARVDLLSSHAAAARRCYAGGLRDCQLALGVIPTMDPVTQWLDAADRRRLVRDRVTYENRRRWDAKSVDACTTGSDTACIAVLRRLPEVPAPLHSWHRLALVQLTATLGGAAAMERLLLTPGTQSERIAAAARLPADSVVHLWLRRAREAEVGSQDMSLEIATASLIWILGCAGLALRSSRWR